MLAKRLQSRADAGVQQGRLLTTMDAAPAEGAQVALSHVRHTRCMVAPSPIDFRLRLATSDDLPALNDLFRRSSLSNEGDRQNLLAHPDALEFSDRAVEQGPVRSSSTPSPVQRARGNPDRGDRERTCPRLLYEPRLHLRRNGPDRVRARIPNAHRRLPVTRAGPLTTRSKRCRPRNWSGRAARDRRSRWRRPR
jgi:hypothetical protein